MQGLLPPISVVFRGKSYLLVFLHLNHNDFRVILRPEKDDENIEEDIDEDEEEKDTSFRVDIVFDDHSSKLFFVPSNCSDSIISQFLQIIDNPSLETNNIRNSVTEEIHYSRTGYTLRKEKIDKLSEMLVSLIGHFEEFLDFMEISDEEAQSLERMYVIKPIDIKKDQYSIFECRDTGREDAFTITARNTFESFCKI